MRNIKKTIALILIASLVLAGCQTQTKVSVDNKTTVSKDGVSLQNMGTFYVGDSIGNQSMIQYIVPETDDKKSPIIMVPGLGLSSYIYTSTPDGRHGWMLDFAKTGHSTYVVDTSDLVLSGFDIDSFNKVKSGNLDPEMQPSLSTWDTKSIWKKWGFGNRKDSPYEDVQYPVENIDELYASFSPQIKAVSNLTGEKNSAKDGQEERSKTIRTNNEQNKRTSNAQRSSGSNSTRQANQQEVDNIIELLEKNGPSILIVHSMGGVTGFEVARQRPDLVKGLIVIEPVGSPTNEEDIKNNFATIPYLAVYGDYIESRNQTGRLESCKTTAKLIKKHGGKADVLVLTDDGINGNTHLMMQDKNSSEIANRISAWIDNNINY
ncbi:MAG: hypothetical protein FH751_08870 [Firmicutes bacterium]|nr:hypothetical protein [Bacillota bacterium]